MRPWTSHRAAKECRGDSTKHIRGSELFVLASQALAYALACGIRGTRAGAGIVMRVMKPGRRGSVELCIEDGRSHLDGGQSSSLETLGSSLVTNHCFLVLISAAAS